MITFYTYMEITFELHIEPAPGKKFTWFVKRGSTFLHCNTDELAHDAQEAEDDARCWAEHYAEQLAVLHKDAS